MIAGTGAIVLLMAASIIPLSLGIGSGVLAARLLLKDGEPALLFMAMLFGWIGMFLVAGFLSPTLLLYAMITWGGTAFVSAMLHVSIWILLNPLASGERFPQISRSGVIASAVIADVLLFCGPLVLMVLVNHPIDRFRALQIMGPYWIGFLTFLTVLDLAWQSGRNPGVLSQQNDDPREV